MKYWDTHSSYFGNTWPRPSVTSKHLKASLPSQHSSLQGNSLRMAAAVASTAAQCTGPAWPAKWLIQSLHSPCPGERFFSVSNVAHVMSAWAKAGWGCRQLRKQSKLLFSCEKLQEDIFLCSKKYLNQTFWFSAPLCKLKARTSLDDWSKVNWYLLIKMKTDTLRIWFFPAQWWWHKKNMSGGNKKPISLKYYHFCPGCSKTWP